MTGLFKIVLTWSIVPCLFVGSACAMTYSNQQDTLENPSIQISSLQDLPDMLRLSIADSLNRYYSQGKPLLKSFSFLSSRGWETRAFSPVKQILRTGRIKLLYFNYLIPGLKYKDETQFEYLLEGYDQNWKDAKKSGLVFYSNIGKGSYTFKLRLKGSNEGTPGCEISQSIEVVIPIWNSSLALVLYFLMFLGGLTFFIQYRTKSLRRANQVLREKELSALKVARQREELSIKNKNITDSIRYAQKIQEALLPTDEYFMNLFPESFVLLQPKDIVSGDFYWISEARGKIFVVSADCTGHGVPGALLSMIGIEMLGKVIHDQGINHPSDILTVLNSGIETAFSRHVRDPLLKEGIDIGLVMVDKKNKRAEFAGAFSTLYLIRDNRLTEVKGNRMTVGVRGSGPDKDFFNHYIELEDKDRMYLFSDGYPDQFGGPKGKKFMYRRFKHLLLTIHESPMKQQMKFLQETLKLWMGETGQVDDIQIIGIQPLK